MHSLARAAVPLIALVLTSGCGDAPADEASAEDTGAFALEQRSCEEANEVLEPLPLSPVEKPAPELDAALTRAINDKGRPCIRVTVTAVPDGWQVDTVMLRATRELKDGSIDSRGFSASGVTDDPSALDRWLFFPRKGCADVSAQLTLRNAEDQPEPYTADGVAGTC